MKILALTRYTELGASSRIRVFQFFPYLEQSGIKITAEPLLGDNYINYLYTNSTVPFIEIVKSYFKRISLLLKKNQFDVIWIQQEAFPWLPYWFEKMLVQSRIPIVVDYDDAFFHRYDLNESKIVKLFLGKKIDSVMNYADVVIAGNQYLADRAISSGCKAVKILPTVVDLTNYPDIDQIEKDFFTIGWIGSPHTAQYLKTIRGALKEISTDKDVKIVFVGADNFVLNDIKFEIRKWNKSTEAAEIQNFDVGIMPLTDSPWERGKCGFKLIQYMASAKPVIASPVGVNVEIVKNGINGFLAKDTEDWIKYFRTLKDNFVLRKEMGSVGRKMAEENYSLQVIAPKLNQIFQNIVKH